MTRSVFMNTNLDPYRVACHDPIRKLNRQYPGGFPFLNDRQAVTETGCLDPLVRRGRVLYDYIAAGC